MPEKQKDGIPTYTTKIGSVEWYMAADPGLDFLLNFARSLIHRAEEKHGQNYAALGPSGKLDIIKGMSYDILDRTFEPASYEFAKMILDDVFHITDCLVKGQDSEDFGPLSMTDES